MKIALAVRHWWRNLRLKNYHLRAAELDDVDFVFDEVLAGTRAGHYAECLLEEQLALRALLNNVIQSHQYARYSNRASKEILFARLWIYGSKRDDAVGFVLVSEIAPGSAISEQELYVMGVRRDRRSAGHGQQLLRLCLSAYRDTTLYARCLPCSDIMFQLLERNHFQHFQTMRQGGRALKWCRTESSEKPSAE